jgi:murein DD-endopeptidase MepM/ murein hydrolase activator NlpD
MQGVARLRQSLVDLFPERHLYLRSGGEMRAYVLTRRKQMVVASCVSVAAVWMGVCTASMMINLVPRHVATAEVVQLTAAHPAALASSAAVQLADAVEKQHAALALLLSDVKDAPGAAKALTPAITHALAVADHDPAHRVEAVRAGQDELLAAADSFAKSRAERLRLAFRLAGLTPAAYVHNGGALGGPLIDAKDPRALAAVLDVDEGFAGRIQHAAEDLSEARALSDAAGSLPFAKPTTGTLQSSSYGVRTDPFTGHPAFHSGLDFAGRPMMAVVATAPGVVAFTGVRSGYGNTVEVDHGHGFKTRYAHLARISVRPGEHVGVGSKLGGMGSTGRSTGTHLHYEVWVNGRAQNPERFVKAGAYVLQAG